MNRLFIFRVLTLISAVFMKEACATSVKQVLTLYTQKLSWNDAYTHCQAEGSDLVIVESSTKLKQLQDWIDWTLIENIWIGLHEIDTNDPTEVQWSTCTDVVYSSFVASEPSNVPDDKRCFYMGTSGLYDSADCSAQMPFVCQRDIGPCDFNYQWQGYGCTLSPSKDEISLTSCLDRCRDAPILNNAECWAVGYWPDYSAEDCWMFHSTGQRDCSVSGNYFQHSSVTLYFKGCYKTETNTTTAIQSTSSSIIPESSCRLQTTVQTTTVNHDITTSHEPTTEGSVSAKMESTTETASDMNNLISTPEIGSNSVSTDYAASTSTNTPQAQGITSVSTDYALSTSYNTRQAQSITSVNADNSSSIAENNSRSPGAASLTTYPTSQDVESSSVQSGTTVPKTTDNWCPCSCGGNLTIIDNEEFQKWKRQMQLILGIDKRKTSRYKRSLISVRDDRVSSVTMGSTGIVILVLFVVIFILFDVHTLHVQICGLYRRMRRMSRA